MSRQVCSDDHPIEAVLVHLDNFLADAGYTLDCANGHFTLTDVDGNSYNLEHTDTGETVIELPRSQDEERAVSYNV